MKRPAYLLASVAVGLLCLAAASVQEETVESRKLPRRLGVSEEEIVHLLASPPVGSGFKAGLVDWVKASFGRSKRKLLLVAVSGNLGSIPSWPFVDVGIIDPRQRRLVCKVNSTGAVSANESSGHEDFDCNVSRGFAI
jgi:hypothetical protein